MNIVYLGLGSNQKSPERQIRRAIKAIKAIPNSSILNISSFYWTKAWGLQTQQDFCNIVMKIVTTIPPHALLRQCKKIEQSQGRVRNRRWGPRTLDIDILLYEDRIVKGKFLTIPHPYMHKRDFVLIPLAEVNSKYAS